MLCVRFPADQNSPKMLDLIESENFRSSLFCYVDIHLFSTVRLCAESLLKRMREGYELSKLHATKSSNQRLRQLLILSIITLQ